MKTTWFKIKNKEIFPIRKPKSIDKLLDQGFVVSKSTETKEGHGGITHVKIETFSPRTRSEYYKAGGK